MLLLIILIPLSLHTPLLTNTSSSQVRRWERVIIRGHWRELSSTKTASNPTSNDTIRVLHVYDQSRCASGPVDDICRATTATSSTPPTLWSGATPSPTSNHGDGHYGAARPSSWSRLSPAAPAPDPATGSSVHATTAAVPVPSTYASTTHVCTVWSFITISNGDAATTAAPIPLLIGDCALSQISEL